MKNRLLGFFILVIMIFVWAFWLLSRQVTEKNISWNENFSWENEEKIIFQELEKTEEIQTSSWRIDEITKQNSNFSYFKIWEEEFFFNIVNSKLEIKFWEKKIWYFDVVLESEIKVSEIFWWEKIFLIELWEKKYIYSKNSWFLKDFETELKINYAKVSEWNYLFFSEGKWSFVLYKQKNQLEFFHLFEDFIFYKNWYIWIVWENEEIRKNKFWLEWKKNFVIYFEPKTKETKIIYELDFLPKNIWQTGEKIFLINTKNSIFFVENFEI